MGTSSVEQGVDVAERCVTHELQAWQWESHELVEHETVLAAERWTAIADIARRIHLVRAAQLPEKTTEPGLHHRSGADRAQLKRLRSW